MHKLSTLNLNEEFDFNPLDFDDRFNFKRKIESFLSRNLNKGNKGLKREILAYISTEISEYLNVFHNEGDMKRYENLKNTLIWLDTEIEMLEFLPETEVQISYPRVWAYIYYYLITSGSYIMETPKTLFYKTISSKRNINCDNFKKEFNKIAHPISGSSYRKKQLHYKDLSLAVGEKELTSHPNSLKLAKRDLAAMKSGLKK